MKDVSAGCRLHRTPDIAVLSGDVFALKPRARQRLVMIGPRCIKRHVTPRQPLADNDAGIEFIKGETALPFWVLTQEQDQVRQQRADTALVVEFQIIGPVMSGLSATSGTITQLLFAPLLHFLKAVLEESLEAAILEAGETIILRPVCRMQGLADG